MKINFNMTLDRVNTNNKEYFNITSLKLSWDADEYVKEF